MYEGRIDGAGISNFLHGIASCAFGEDIEGQRTMGEPREAKVGSAQFLAATKRWVLAADKNACRPYWIGKHFWHMFLCLALVDFAWPDADRVGRDGRDCP